MYWSLEVDTIGTSFRVLSVELY